MLEAGPGIQEAEELGAEYTGPLPTFHHFTPASSGSPKLSQFSQNKETEAVVAETKIAANSRKNVPGAATVTENGVINASDNSSRLNLNGSGSAATAAATPSSSSTITYIPGDYKGRERGHSYVSGLET